MKPSDPSGPPTVPYPSYANDTPEVEAPTRISAPLSFDDATSAAGIYAVGEVLGRGGMGEVLLALDRKIGRHVALKRLRKERPSEEELARFVREARIQARLDHPAIVPVHEIGRDHNGRTYFTMKRLAGQQMSAALKGNPSRARLLRAFVDVCRAVDFAHTRGVVHRDIKPANIVLGEFGEVYVIDWGTARVLDDPDPIAAPDGETLEGSAPPGRVFGTPGYMAPEQYERPEIDRSADVYALGATLFELLAGEPLHPREGQAAMTSTLADLVNKAPSKRRPERGIAPELDEVCISMLQRDPRARPNARRCAERVEAYLDGDRDLAQRRALASDAVLQARAALAEDQRSDAMALASRALALDPYVPGAAELVTNMMLTPPRETPSELRDVLAAADDDDVSRHARSAMPGYLVIAAFTPLVALIGVRSAPAVLAMFFSAIALAFAARRLAQQPARSPAWMTMYAVGNAAVMALVARVTNPFLVVPPLVTFMTASIITYPMFLRRPVLLFSIMFGGMVAPLLLAVAHVWPMTWELRDEGILLRADAMPLGTTGAFVVVFAATIAALAMAAVHSTIMGRAKRDAQHRLVTQAWHLAQLLPSHARAATVPPPA